MRMIFAAVLAAMVAGCATAADPVPTGELTLKEQPCATRRNCCSSTTPWRAETSAPDRLQLNDGRRLTPQLRAQARRLS